MFSKYCVPFLRLRLHFIDPFGMSPSGKCKNSSSTEEEQQADGKSSRKHGWVKMVALDENEVIAPKERCPFLCVHVLRK